MIACQLTAQSLGWLLTFPNHTNAGLVLFTSSEQTEFIISCGFDHTLDFDIERIDQCPTDWYNRAQFFKPTF